MESARTRKRTHAGICHFREHSPELRATWGIVANDIAVPVRPKSVIRLAGPSLGIARAWNSCLPGNGGGACQTHFALIFAAQARHHPLRQVLMELMAPRCMVKPFSIRLR